MFFIFFIIFYLKLKNSKFFIECKKYIFKKFYTYIRFKGLI